MPELQLPPSWYSWQSAGKTCLRGVCETAKDWLDHYDLTGLE